MAQVILALFALLSLYIGYVYLFNHEQALKWDNSQRLFRGASNTVQDEAWYRRARRRGISAILLGVFLLAIVAGVL
jgi:hypothetical protein